MTVNETLSDYVAGEIRASLARQRTSGRELADKLGVSRSWVSYRLTGTTEITVNDLQRIAAALGVDVAALLPTPARSRESGRGLTETSAPSAGRPRSTQLLDRAHHGKHASDSSERATSRASDTVSVGQSRAPHRLCVGVTR